MSHAFFYTRPNSRKCNLSRQIYNDFLLLSMPNNIGVCRVVVVRALSILNQPFIQDETRVSCDRVQVLTISTRWPILVQMNLTCMLAGIGIGFNPISCGSRISVRACFTDRPVNLRSEHICPPILALFKQASTGGDRRAHHGDYLRDIGHCTQENIIRPPYFLACWPRGRGGVTPAARLAGGNTSSHY